MSALKSSNKKAQVLAQLKTREDARLSQLQQQIVKIHTQAQDIKTQLSQCQQRIEAIDSDTSAGNLLDLAAWENRSVYRVHLRQQQGALQQHVDRLDCELGELLNKLNPCIARQESLQLQAQRNTRWKKRLLGALQANQDDEFWGGQFDCAAGMSSGGESHE